MNADDSGWHRRRYAMRSSLVSSDSTDGQRISNSALKAQYVQIVLCQTLSIPSILKFTGLRQPVQPAMIGPRRFIRVYFFAVVNRIPGQPASGQTWTQ